MTNFTLIDKICSRKRWIFLTSFLALVILFCTGYIIYLRFFCPESPEAIFRRFRNVFYTDEQIQKFRQLGTVKINVFTNSSSNKYNYTGVEFGIDGRGIVDNSTWTINNSSNSYNSSNSSNSRNNTEGLLGRILSRTEESIQSQYRYHGCCRSRAVLVFPDEMPELRTYDNKRVRAVRLPDKRQFFWKDECLQVPDCTGCSCHQEMTLTMIVVVDDNGDADTLENSRLEQVQVPGCCKCLNGNF